MEFFKTKKIDEVIKIINDEFCIELHTEKLELALASDRFLAKDFYATENIPQFKRSTVDGYAVNSTVTYGASNTVPTILKIQEEIEMGEAAKQSVAKGFASYVPTGGMLPDGSNAVVMIEHTEKMDDETLLVFKPVSVNSNTIQIGEDMEEGELMLRKGTKLKPAAIGVLSAQGQAYVEVFKKLSFYIISTGDELVNIEDKPKLGQIRDINTHTLAAAINELGAEVVGKRIVEDDFKLLLQAIEEAVEAADIVLISGGSSVGARDYTQKAIETIGGKGVLVHGLSIKPGKPTIVGDVGGKLVVGLPGHPVSSLVVFDAIIKPFVRKCYFSSERENTVVAKTTTNFPSSPGKTTYHLVKLIYENGETKAEPCFGKSGLISLLARADGMIIIEPHEEGVSKGEIREVVLI